GNIVGADVERHVTADRRRSDNDDATRLADNEEGGDDCRERQKQQAKAGRYEPAGDKACRFLDMDELVEVLVERLLARFGDAVAHDRSQGSVMAACRRSCAFPRSLRQRSGASQAPYRAMRRQAADFRGLTPKSAISSPRSFS